MQRKLSADTSLTFMLDLPVKVSGEQESEQSSSEPSRQSGIPLQIRPSWKLGNKCCDMTQKSQFVAHKCGLSGSQLVHQKTRAHASVLLWPTHRNQMDDVLRYMFWSVQSWAPTHLPQFLQLVCVWSQNGVFSVCGFFTPNAHLTQKWTYRNAHFVIPALCTPSSTRYI